MKKIVIFNGAGRKNGKTAEMIKAFAEGAEGCEITEFFLQNMNIRGCVNCHGCAKKEKGCLTPCVQRDDMDKIYPAFIAADVIVFASPVYFWDITGPLKTAIDRTYSVFVNSGIPANKKECALLMTSGGSPLDHMLDWFKEFERQLGWRSLGAALNDVDAARRIGESVK